MQLHFLRFILILLDLDLTKLSIFRKLSIMTPKFLTKLAMGILQSPTVTDETERLLRFTLKPNMMNSVI